MLTCEWKVTYLHTYKVNVHSIRFKVKWTITIQVINKYVRNHHIFTKNPFPKSKIIINYTSLRTYDRNIF